MDHLKTYALWREKLAGTAWEDQLQAMENDEEAIRDAFSSWVEFGTAGMRGVLGPGPNRLNVFTVRRATQGLADYINSISQAQRGVAIAYDSRRNSALFARETALTLAANGVKALLYPEYTSVPQLSFTILHLNCAAGVVITASHNPAKYNGYKVYGPDGGQLANEGADAVLSFIDPIEDCFTLPTMEEQAAIDAGLLQYLGPELDDDYVARVKEQCREPQALREFGHELKLVYTPLNGTGMRTVPRVLTELGLENLHIVEAQMEPDGDFPTVSAPNPEMPEAFDLSRQLADKVGADLLLATDPDCDRLGVALRQPGGDFLTLTGNQIGCLLLDADQLEALGQVDILMVPVGGFYTIDAETAFQVVEQLDPRVIIPMHYRTEYNAEWPIGPVKDFTRLFDPASVRSGSNLIRITKNDLVCQPRVSVL